jgi:redox-sensitive bicupin YhaK (pirin superfamily)
MSELPKPDAEHRHGPVLRRIPLGFQWQTADPFLFCVHHLDRYPSATAELGPAASLAGRTLGQDFDGIDGWRMYHGQVVPGFPAHPHRGFETVTYVRQGLIDHSDSLGAAARFGRGDVQWLTAGTGVMHSEMFPLLDGDGPNTLELFQIWLNLPAVDKLVEPHFSMLWDAEIPRHIETDSAGRTVEVTVIAGRLGDAEPPSPPPASWASRPEADLAIWHIVLDPGATWVVPPAALGGDTGRTLYVFEGTQLSIDGEQVGGSVGVVVDAGRPVTIAAGDRVEILMLQARPLGEPVAQYGPFVMNTRAEIEQTIADYQRTQFGGWPWDRPDPVHGSDPTRFARHADGRVERVGS